MNLLLKYEHRGALAFTENQAHQLSGADRGFPSPALKTFVKDKMILSVLLRIDDTTAVVYINNKRERCPKSLYT